MRCGRPAYWARERVQVLHVLGEHFGPLLSDRHLLVQQPVLARSCLKELLLTAGRLHPQLATLKLVWKAKMRTHRNGWRKVMNERLAWQRVTAELRLPQIGWPEQPLQTAEDGEQPPANGADHGANDGKSSITINGVQPAHRKGANHQKAGSVQSEPGDSPVVLKLYPISTKPVDGTSSPTLSWSGSSSTSNLSADRREYPGLIVPLYEFIETEACYGFVGGHLPGGCSLGLLLQSAPIPEPLVKVLSAQMALAVHHCHRAGLLLRTLNRHSFLVDADCNAFLADFENAKLTDCSGHSPHAGHAVEYMAPEQMQRQLYSREADWFALGVLLLEMHYGRTAFHLHCERRQLRLEVDANGAYLARPPTELLLRGRTFLSFFN